MKKKKTQRKLLQTLNKHFYSEICRCHVTGNVDMILQSEVDQTDKINTIISHDPQWAGKALTVHWKETNHHTQYECEDSLLVVCQILPQRRSSS